MKRIIFVLILACTITLVWGQSQNNSGLVFKRLFMDYQTLHGGDFGAFRDYTDGFEVGYFFPVIDNLDVYIPLKVGLGNRSDEEINNRLLGLDIQGQYHFIQNPNIISPYFLAGVGAVYENSDSFNLQFPLGIGIDFKIASNAYFTWQSEFRPSTNEDKHNFHHGLGFKYMFGGANDVVMPEEEIEMVTDTDGDGINDEMDDCPTIPGLAAFKGCPDTDNDGIQDSKDDCPEYPGLKELNGCPDTDGDGVSDAEDQCPNIAGIKENNGCPGTDTDGDGVLDMNDACPNLAGSLLTKGCPDSDNDGIADNEDRCPYKAGLTRFNGCPDTDGDGVSDNIDQCPNTAGPADNNGCPRISTADREVLEFAMKAVQFEHSRATLKRESFAVLNQIRDIMNRYPDYKLEIGGHTDSTGGDELNRRLSNDRAKACYNYLISQSIPASRINYVGYGETKPIADNDTYAGRSLNRRVEFNLSPGGF
jgi:outer membrane protein OmpA-like peptidoglycan-associated protein